LTEKKKETSKEEDKTPEDGPVLVEHPKKVLVTNKCPRPYTVWVELGDPKAMEGNQQKVNFIPGCHPVDKKAAKAALKSKWLENQLEREGKGRVKENFIVEKYMVEPAQLEKEGL
jgi:hypothetical protein